MSLVSTGLPFGPAAPEAPRRAPLVSPRLSDDKRLLTVSLGSAHRTLSWALVGGGFARASAVAWRHVSDAELGPDVDATQLLGRALADAGLVDAVGLLTARDLSTFECVTRQAGDLTARAVATVGLSNALSVGDPPSHAAVGTINLLVQVTTPLADVALVELLGLATEARTAAVLEARVPSRVSSRLATGTGTDCIVVAAPDAGGQGAVYAGKHTALGALAGAVVREAIARGVQRWIAKEVALGVQSTAPQRAPSRPRQPSATLLLAHLREYA
jgi:adenosylcobinamide amidohydrolase